MAVYYFERRTTQFTTTSTSFSTALTISAADLTGAGFANDDDVLLVVWGLFQGGAAGAAEVRADVTYNGSSISGNPIQLDPNGPGATGVEQNASWMFRVDLNTVSDIDVDIASGTGGTQVASEDITVLVLKLSDFGVEDTDWWWNENTSLTDLDNTMTSFASETFTPAAGDYIILGNVQAVIDTTGDSFEAQIVVDGAVGYGPLREEGESATEETSYFMWHESTLTNASHTIAIQCRDDAGATNNDHRRSAILIFAKSKWPDLFTTLPGTVSIPGTTATQIATLTNSMSVTQDAVFLGLTRKTTDATDEQGFIWVRQGGSTVIDPVVDNGSGISNWGSHDATDLKNSPLVGFLNVSSGAQDLDLFFYTDEATTLNALHCRFMLWGMNQTVAVTGTGASTLDGVTSAGTGTVVNPVTGTGASTLDGATSAGTGVETFTGTGASTLDGVTSAGSGLVANPVSGTGASTLDGVTSAGTGLVIQPVTGTGASTLADITSAGVGILGITGTGSTILDGATSSGAGLAANPVSGTGASTLTGVIAAGIGLVLVPGNIANVTCGSLGPASTCDSLSVAGSCGSVAPLVVCGAE